jgi:hypothetical protein
VKPLSCWAKLIRHQYRVIGGGTRRLNPAFEFALQIKDHLPPQNEREILSLCRSERLRAQKCGGDGGRQSASYAQARLAQGRRKQNSRTFQARRNSIEVSWPNLLAGLAPHPRWCQCQPEITADASSAGAVVTAIRTRTVALGSNYQTAVLLILAAASIALSVFTRRTDRRRVLRFCLKFRRSFPASCKSAASNPSVN